MPAHLTKEIQRTEKTLEKLAAQVLEQDFSEVAGDVEISVRYFGNGNRFAVRRKEKGFKLLLFVSPANAKNFSALLSDAGAALERIHSQRVSVRKETLLNLLAAADTSKISREELQELQSLLRD